MKRFWKVVKNTVAVVIIAAAVFGAGYYVAKLPTADAKIIEPSENAGIDLKLPGEVEKTIVTVNEVRAKIQEIGELTSCEGSYIVTKGQDFTRYMLDDIPVLGTTNHIELTCAGSVKAGYDLEDIVVKVDNDSQKIYVSLPEAKINSNQLTWDSSMECNEKNNILNPIDFEQYQTLISDIKAEGLREAEKNGLYDTVEQNAKNLITNFLGCFAGYEVVFM